MLPTLPLGLALMAAAAAASARDIRESVSAPPWHSKVDPWVLSTVAAGETEFLVLLAEQADLGGADLLLVKEDRGRFVFDRLRATAAATQGPLLDLLVARGAEHQPFWVANMIKVRGGPALIEELAVRDDVARLHANPAVRAEEGTLDSTDALVPLGVAPGVVKVRAPELWAAGYSGQSVVIGGQDTGYDWDHPALKEKYRGYFSPFSTDHNYNWHDAIHIGGGACGPNSPAPCDDTGHGTHTMGTMVGDDGAGNQIGVAPGARWIGCRSLDRGYGTPAGFAECVQWFIAPTDLAGQNPDPLKAPHVIHNSWNCPPSAGCTDPDLLRAVVEMARAAGIMVVTAAGDGGPRCGTVNAPPATYESAVAVGATNLSDRIAFFSSRGPVTVDGSNRLKPNVSAPGVGVRSAVPDGGYATTSGTAMAASHATGVAVLLLSAVPALKGQVGVLEATLEDSAVGLTGPQTCGGVPVGQVPNNMYGHGRVDAHEAVRSHSADIALTSTPWPPVICIGQILQYTLNISNAGPQAASNVSLFQNLPPAIFFPNADPRPSQGWCHIAGANIFCDLGTIASGGFATVDVATGPVTGVGTGTSLATIRSNVVDLGQSDNSLTLEITGEQCPPHSRR